MPNCSRNGNVITITLSDDEVITMDYVDKLSSVFFSNFIRDFLAGRKLQHEDELKRELMADMTRDQLLAATASGGLSPSKVII
jgi:hypothetical protein